MSGGFVFTCNKTMSHYLSYKNGLVDVYNMTADKSNFCNLIRRIGLDSNSKKSHFFIFFSSITSFIYVYCKSRKTFP